MTESAARQRGLIPPVIDADSRAWWDALAERRLLLPECRPNGHVWFPPSPSCPHCGSPDTTFRLAAGQGRIHSWVVTHRAFHPAFRDDVPYTIAAVQLAEGPRIFARFVAPAGHPIAAGMPVHAVFYEVQGQTLVGFAP